MGNLTDSVDLVTSHRLSTVVPGRLTEDDTMHELEDIDLAMKLHYINCLYFFKPIISDDKNVGTDECKEFVNISQLKLPMFSLLSAYNQVSGRMRGGRDGERPYIKCNDCGVRIVEARCGLTVEDVIQMDDYQPVFDGLVYKMVLGPDLGFSPLVIFQFTWFKCGGFAVGLRWAHVLGDAFSASAFINRWAKLYSNDPTSPISIKGPVNDKARLVPGATTKQLCFAKRVDPVDNHWVVNSNVKTKTHIFRVGAKQLSQIRSNTCGYGAEFPPFEILSAILWKSIAKLRRNDDELKLSCVTICRRNPEFETNQALSNSQVISTAETNLNVADAELEDLVKLIFNAKRDEKRLIKDEDLESDFMVYGANLTFVDLGEMRLYDMKLNGKRPVSAVCSMDGVGEEGLVLVAPDNDEDGGDGRIVIVTFDEEKFVEMEIEIKQTWGIA